MKRSFKQFLLEVNVHGKDYRHPVKDTETIRVYHGFNRIEDAILACAHGISGKTYAQRIYSYEANNNPKGLFVTTQLKVAKEFGAVVMEFHTKVSDLEAPVWPNGRYTVQGELSADFKDDKDRTAHRLRRREKLKSAPYKEISQSDRPELADTLLAGENQALFIGDLNPNSIRGIWLDPAALAGGLRKVNSTFTRVSPKKFLEMTRSAGLTAKERGRNYRDDAKPAHKLFFPREKFSEAEFMKRIRKLYPTIPSEQIVDILRTNPDYRDRYFWPNQMADAERFLGTT